MRDLYFLSCCPPETFFSQATSPDRRKLWCNFELCVKFGYGQVVGFSYRPCRSTTADGRQRLVRHGHLPERTIQTDIGSVEVQQPRARDAAARREDLASPDPLAARRSKSPNALIPILYLRGISSGDFQEALAARKDAPDLSPAVLDRLKASRGGVRTLAAARSFSQALCVYLGRWRRPPVRELLQPFAAPSSAPCMDASQLVFVWFWRFRLCGHVFAFVCGLPDRWP